MNKTTFEQPSIMEDSITELSRKLLTVTEQLAESNEQLQQAQRERTDMLANLSHDLRAPVTAIRGAVDYLLLAPRNLTEETVGVLRVIDQRTKNLENLIQDMYDLFSMESSAAGMNFELVEAAPFLEEYFYSALLDTRYDDHEMKLDLSENLKAMLKIDIQKMIRVLDNLLTNAEKYSHPGSEIVLGAAMTEDGNWLDIFVTDEGIGIPEESLNHIFNRTYTVSSARTPNSATGSGLGLSIVKAIAEIHGGSVHCHSKLGKGSTFTLRLPICRI